MLKVEYAHAKQLPSEMMTMIKNITAQSRVSYKATPFCGGGGEDDKNMTTAQSRVSNTQQSINMTADCKEAGNIYTAWCACCSEN